MSTRVLAAMLAGMVIGCAGPIDPYSAADNTSDPVPGSRAGATPRSFTLIATGDVLIHQDGPLVGAAAAVGRVERVGYDFSGVFAPVADLIKGADLAICHLETPVADAAGPFRGYPLFNVQPQIIDALAAVGYDTCSTASNHSFDAGFDGVRRTLDKLDSRHMGHTGTFRTLAESRTPRIIEVRGVRVGHISWTYGLNGISPSADRHWSVNVFDPRGPETAGLLADALRARQAGAEVVVASVHCCQEYEHDPTPAQLALATSALSSPDVDLVLFHHSHVVEPVERINGKWVAYGLGNHVAEQYRGDTEDSMIARFTFTEGANGHFAVTRAEAIPIRINLGGQSVTLVNTARRGPRSAADTASYRRVVDILNRRGAAAAGLTITDH